MDPATVAILKMLAFQKGADILGGMFGGGQSPYEKAMTQQAQYAGRLMPELYSQAMGKPSAATQNIMRQVQQDITRQQQAFAASAQRASPTMRALPTPVRVGQQRYQQAGIQARAGVMGEAQQRAQEALMGYGTAAQAEMGRLEAQEQEARNYTMASIGRIVGQYQALKQNPEVAQRVNTIMQLIRQFLGFDTETLIPEQPTGAEGYRMPSPSEAWYL